MYPVIGAGSGVGCGGIISSLGVLLDGAALLTSLVAFLDARHPAFSRHRQLTCRCQYSIKVCSSSAQTTTLGQCFPLTGLSIAPCILSVKGKVFQAGQFTTVDLACTVGVFARQDFFKAKLPELVMSAADTAVKQRQRLWKGRLVTVVRGALARLFWSASHARTCLRR